MRSSIPRRRHPANTTACTGDPHSSCASLIHACIRPGLAHNCSRAAMWRCKRCKSRRTPLGKRNTANTSAAVPSQALWFPCRCIARGLTTCDQRQQQARTRRHSANNICKHRKPADMAGADTSSITVLLTLKHTTGARTHLHYSSIISNSSTNTAYPLHVISITLRSLHWLAAALLIQQPASCAATETRSSKHASSMLCMLNLQASISLQLWPPVATAVQLSCCGDTCTRGAGTNRAFAQACTPT
jgi:hypothetical protein